MIGHLTYPGDRVFAHQAHFVVGTGGRLVRQVGRKQGRPIVLNHHRVVLWHVHSWRELVEACKRNTAAKRGGIYLSSFESMTFKLLKRHQYSIPCSQGGLIAQYLTNM